MIQAIMGVTRVAELTRQFKDNKAYAPQLEGKYIGLMLQKVLRTKQDGSDTGFQILCPFFHNTKKPWQSILKINKLNGLNGLLDTLKIKTTAKNKINNKIIKLTTLWAINLIILSAPLADNLDDEIPF